MILRLLNAQSEIEQVSHYNEFLSQFKALIFKAWILKGNLWIQGLKPADSELLVTTENNFLNSGGDEISGEDWEGLEIGAQQIQQNVCCKCWMLGHLALIQFFKSTPIELPYPHSGLKRSLRHHFACCLPVFIRYVCRFGWGKVLFGTKKIGTHRRKSWSHPKPWIWNLRGSIHFSRD